LRANRARSFSLRKEVALLQCLYSLYYSVCTRFTARQSRAVLLSAAEKSLYYSRNSTESSGIQQKLLQKRKEVALLQQKLGRISRYIYIKRSRFTTGETRRNRFATAETTTAAQRSRFTTAETRQSKATSLRANRAARSFSLPLYYSVCTRFTTVFELALLRANRARSCSLPQAASVFVLALLQCLYSLYCSV
jgi:hypothetical protein